MESLLLLLCSVPWTFLAINWLVSLGTASVSDSLSSFSSGTRLASQQQYGDFQSGPTYMADLQLQIRTSHASVQLTFAVSKVLPMGIRRTCWPNIALCSSFKWIPHRESTQGISWQTVDWLPVESIWVLGSDGLSLIVTSFQRMMIYTCPIYLDLWNVISSLLDHVSDPWSLQN